MGSSPTAERTAMEEDLLDYEAASGDDAPAEPPSDGETATRQSPLAALPPIPDVFSVTITPALWASMGPAMRQSFVANAPLTVQKVHTMDADAQVAQRKLEDEEAAEALAVATARRTTGRDRVSTLEASRVRLEQQLQDTNREVLSATSAAATHDVAVAVAERAAASLQASRHPRSSRASVARPSPPRPQGPTDRRHSPPSSPLSLSPRTRSYRDVIAAPRVHTGQPIDSLFFDTLLVDFVQHIQHGFDVDTRRTIHERATSLLDTFEPYTGATLRFVFRHIDTAPVSEELTSAAHALVAAL
ncbi:unnamed protein product [Laminaria digitata]